MKARSRQADSSDYNQSYYQKNKDRISKRRKRKYQEDPDYRKCVLKRSSRYYDSNKKRLSPTDRRIVRTTSGDKLFSIGKLAAFTKRKIQTIRSYHRRGVIPNPMKYDRRGWRLYTAKQVALCQKAFTKFDKGIYSSLDEVAEFLKEHWEE